jgi:hypothetical protein
VAEWHRSAQREIKIDSHHTIPPENPIWDKGLDLK